MKTIALIPGESLFSTVILWRALDYLDDKSIPAGTIQTINLPLYYRIQNMQLFLVPVTQAPRWVLTQSKPGAKVIVRSDG
jgi:hypothetical protein